MAEQVFVEINGGSFRNVAINGTFPLLKPFRRTPKSQFVTVSLNKSIGGLAPQPHGARVKVNLDQFRYVDMDGNEVEVQDDTTEVPVEAVPGMTVGGSVAAPSVSSAEREVREMESEEEALDRMRSSFEVLDRMTLGCSEGKVRGLIVTSAPGTGKSHTVEQRLKEENLTRVMEDKPPRFEILKGSVSAVRLYQCLYESRAPGNVVVLDDADIWGNEETLNILKAALDDKKVRHISWLKQNKQLEKEDIPDKFEFEGAVIFLTNLDPSDTRSEKMRRHLEALNSRCLYIDLDITTRRDRLVRIKQVMQEGLLDEFNLAEPEENEIYEFVRDYFDDMNEQSLRAVKKVAELFIANPGGWQEDAVYTCMNPEARWRHRLEHMKAERGIEDAEESDTE
jgi:hypothetical protein